jgi:asparagine synthase (glutamine-hydrolysing)
VSGICGFFGAGDPAWLDAMLGAIAYRGDTNRTVVESRFGLGYRFWHGRPGKAQAIFEAADGARTVTAGTLAPVVADPAAVLDERLRAGDFAALDGAFCAARVDAAREELTLLRDPFGVRSLYYVEHRGVLVFATELKQLLALPGLPIELDTAAVHKYLTFSFVPGTAVPVLGIKRLLPGARLRMHDGKLELDTWFTLQEQLDPELNERAQAVRQLRALGAAAVARRLQGETRAGLYLSGGIDSSAIAHWLQQAGLAVQAFSLDFGAASVEREQAASVAQHLALPLEWVTVSGADVLGIVSELAWKLDLPFGDAVTAPQFLLGRAARLHSLSAVWNGEGGDQFFGGWTSKPMIAAALYDGTVQQETPEEQYLRSYHRFYGLEEQLYSEEFKARCGGPGQRRALLAPYLGDERTAGFLNRMRLGDVALKGSQNILPRAERIANGHGLDVRVPLFDRALAEFSMRLPVGLKLHGACEKYVLKLAMQQRLPESVIWRRKFGMSVPMTDWLLGPKGTPPERAPLAPLLEELLSEPALRARGLFRPEYVARLRRGQDEPFETRRRRVGEKLWALCMLEQWLRIFIDGRGAAP